VQGKGIPCSAFPSILGRPVPAYRTAPDKVLLAHLSPGERCPVLAGRLLERRTAKTITSPRRL
jgi:DNA-binding IclR family transcriptional regulator